jgi:hypothetical protein
MYSVLIRWKNGRKKDVLIHRRKKEKNRKKRKRESKTLSRARTIAR